jgi:two-component system, NarL family, nitrate/nitrite response regulator NarL
METPQPRRITVGIVSDLRLYREGLTEALGRMPDLEVAGSAPSKPDAYALVDARGPDVTLLDLSMPDVGEIARGLLERSGTRIVALTVGYGEGAVISWAEAGVSGYVTRDDGLEDLVKTIRSVDRGELHCSPRIAAILLKQVAAASVGGHNAADDPRVAALTKRERQILELLEAGRSNKQIAFELSIEVATVKNHVHGVLEKLGVAGRGEAAAVARRCGIQTYS